MQKKNFAKNFFLKIVFFSSPNMYQAKSGVKNFPFTGKGGRGAPPQKSCSEWAETNFGFGIFEIQWFLGEGGSLCEIQMYNWMDRHTP